MMICRSQRFQGAARRYSYGQGMYSTDGSRVYLGAHYFKDPTLPQVSRCYNYVNGKGPETYLQGLSFTATRLILVGNVYIREDDPEVPLYSERAVVSDDYIVWGGQKLYRNDY